MTHKERHELVKQMFKSGKSVDEIKEATGYKWNTIKIILNKSGISYATKVKYDYTGVEEMKRDGMSITEIGKVTGIPRNCISTYLCRNEDAENKQVIPRSDFMTDEEIAKLPHAKPIMKHIFVDNNGKKWVDTTETLFEQPDIIMLR